MKKQKVILFFSNVIDTPIYRGIIEEFSTSDFDLVCFFFGSESQPLFDFTRSGAIPSKLYADVSKTRVFPTFISIIGELIKFRPNFVLTFGQIASLIGLAGSLISSRAKRVYLRMHTSMHRIENSLNGKIYDRACNLFANLIVVPNNNTKQYLQFSEKIDPRKIRQIEFGFNLADFNETPSARISVFRQEFQLEASQFIIGIVSRYSPVKGLQYSLPAVANFLKNHAEGVLVLVGIGENPPQGLLDLVKDIDPKQLRLIPRVHDMPAFYKNLSVFVHTPIDEVVESFGLVYVEAIAAETPSIVTLSGIAKDICVNGSNCLVVSFRNAKEIENSLEKLYIDKELRLEISHMAKSSVSHLSMYSMRKKYRELVLSTLQ